VPQWRQKLAEKKEQLKTGQAEIDDATKRLSAAKKRRDSKPEPVKAKPSEAKSATATTTTTASEKPSTDAKALPPSTAQGGGGGGEPQADGEVKCGGCGKSQKKSKFCSGCGNPIVEAYALFLFLFSFSFAFYELLVFIFCFTFPIRVLTLQSAYANPHCHSHTGCGEEGTDAVSASLRKPTLRSKQTRDQGAREETSDHARAYRSEKTCCKHSNECEEITSLRELQTARLQEGHVHRVLPAGERAWYESFSLFL
jgi:hypothetical protein